MQHTHFNSYGLDIKIIRMFNITEILIVFDESRRASPITLYLCQSEQIFANIPQNKNQTDIFVLIKKKL